MKSPKTVKPKTAKPFTAKPKTTKPVKLPKAMASGISLARALSLEPQPRKVLNHLETVGTISPLEAFGVYKITRLAAAVNELRKAGVGVTTRMRRDMTGTRYATYSLAA